MSASRRNVAVVVLALATVLASCSTTRTKTPTREDASTDASQRDTTPVDPKKRAAIRFQLAVGYYQEGKFAIALDELKQVIAADPTSADAHMLVGMVYTELGENALAEQGFQRALALAPKNPDVNNNYGWYLCQHGRERDALGYFEIALRDPLYPQKARPLQNAGVCATKIGDAALAEDYFRRSFELDPAGVVSAYNLALIFYERKELPRARFYVAQVNNSPIPTPASLWLGIRIEHRLGNKTNEVALANQLERMFADSREAQMQRRGNYND